ncbi:MAG: transposase [Saprospiraceae bacterium]|nr:transposase [Saprospiraceae bacterium]
MLADREFIGAEWFHFLRACGFSFVIRLRHQDYLGLVAASIKKTVAKTDGHIRRRLRRDGFFKASIEILGYTYTYVVFPNTGSRKGTDEFVVLLSDMADAAKISEAYRKRWGIEVFFLHCKTNGFNMEDLNFKNLEKVQLLMALAAVAYVFSLLNGLIKEGVKPIALKITGTKRRGPSLCSGLGLTT